MYTVVNHYLYLMCDIDCILIEYSVCVNLISSCRVYISNEYMARYIYEGLLSE